MEELTANANALALDAHPYRPLPCNFFGCLGPLFRPDPRDPPAMPSTPTRIIKIHVDHLRPVTYFPKEKRHGLPLPTELILEILEHGVFTARDLIRVGRTCHQLCQIINDPLFSKQIIDRHRPRLLSPPTLAELPLLEAFRDFLAQHTFHRITQSIGSFQAAYMPLNISVDVQTGIAAILKMLFRINDIAHSSISDDSFCRRTHREKTLAPCVIGNCDALRYRSGFTNPVDQALWKFRASNWRDDRALLEHLRRYGYRDPSVQDMVSEDQFKSMVQCVVETPLEYYSSAAIKAKWDMIESFLIVEPPLETCQSANNSMQSLALLTGLPELDKTTDGQEAVYVFGTHPYLAKMIERGDGDGSKVLVRGKGLMALKEICRDANECQKEKLLDPGSRLAKAFIFEEIRIRSMSH